MEEVSLSHVEQVCIGDDGDSGGSTLVMVVAGRMQLFTRAFTSRICDRRLFYPSLYIPGTVFHPPLSP